MLLLCLVQMFIYVMCLAMPAFIGVIGHLTVSAAGLISAVLGFPISEPQLFILYCVHWLIYGGTWLAHLYVARFNKVRRSECIEGCWHPSPPSALFSARSCPTTG